MSQFIRENTRYPVELAVRVRCPTWDDYLDLYTTNLSRGGVFVASNVSAPMGTEVNVRLSLPNGTELELHAEVVHLTDKEEGRVPGMGLMFSDLDEETRRALEAMVTVARFTSRHGVGQTRAAPVPAAAPAPTAPAAAAMPTRTDSHPVVASDEPAGAPPPIPEDAPRSRAPMFGDVVEQALFDELARRIDLKPHAQLGIELTAVDYDIEEAHTRLLNRYQSVIFKRYGDSTQEVVKKINELVSHAYGVLRDPALRRAAIDNARDAQQPVEMSSQVQEQKARGEEARKALKASIDRRVEEACRFRDLGQLEDAIRTFEAVLTLDRKNDYARAELQSLRDRAEAARTGKPVKSGIIDRLLKR